MTLDEPATILIILLLLVPGSLGASLSRAIHRVGEPTNDFRRVLDAVSWAVAALGLVEAVNSFVTSAAFGEFLLLPISALDSTGGISGSLTSRWVVFVIAAATVPTVSRYGLEWFIERVTNRTLPRPSIDEISRYAPLHGESMLMRVILTNGTTMDGWLRWRTVGLDDEAALILQSRESDSVTWIPARSILSLTALAPDDGQPE